MTETEKRRAELTLVKRSARQRPASTTMCGVSMITQHPRSQQRCKHMGFTITCNLGFAIAPPTAMNHDSRPRIAHFPCSASVRDFVR